MAYKAEQLSQVVVYHEFDGRDVEALSSEAIELDSISEDEAIAGRAG